MKLLRRKTLSAPATSSLPPAIIAGKHSHPLLTGTTHADDGTHIHEGGSNLNGFEYSLGWNAGKGRFPALTSFTTDVFVRSAGSSDLSTYKRRELQVALHVSIGSFGLFR